MALKTESAACHNFKNVTDNRNTDKEMYVNVDKLYLDDTCSA